MFGLIFIFSVVILLSRFPQKQGLPFSSKRNVLRFSFFLVIQIWYSNVIWRTSTQETSEVLRLTVHLFSLFDWFVTCDGSNMIATEMLQWRKLAWSQKSVASVTLHLKIWIDIWKHTVEKSRTNAASATLHSYRQANWRYIRRRTVEKNQTSATSVNLPARIQVHWGHIWKHILEKSQTNATNVTMPLLVQAIWGNIWKRTVEKSQTNATNVTLPALIQVLWGDIWRVTDQCRKEKIHYLSWLA